MARGVPHGIPAEALLPCLHELLGPGIERTGLDPLPPAQVADRDLPPEAFQDNAELLLGSVPPARRRPNASHEAAGLLGAYFCLLAGLIVFEGHAWLLSSGSTVPLQRSLGHPWVSSVSWASELSHSR